MSKIKQNYIFNRLKFSSYIMVLFYHSIMGKTCAAANCTNRSDTTENTSFHSFPNKEKDESRYKEWVRQVQTTRANWQGPSSQHTFVCSDHFH